VEDDACDQGEAAHGVEGVQAFGGVGHGVAILKPAPNA
jgi:hypothetical protein